MAWTIVGVGTVAETTTTTLTLTEPAGVADGDLLVACIASRSTATTAVTNTGWTAVNSQNNNNTLTTTSALASGTMLYQVRAGAPDLTFVIPAGVSVSMGRIVAYRGSAATTPLDVSTAVTTGTNVTAVSVTGLTTTQADDLIVAMAAGGQEAAWSSFNATTPSGASGATDRADTNTTTGADTSLGIFDALKTTAGATGSLTATATLGAGHVVIAGAFKILPTADAWNVSDKSVDIALSASDRTATNSAGVSGGVRSTQTYLNGTAGKYYAEVAMGSQTPTQVGICPTSNALTATTSNFYVQPANGFIFVNGVYSGTTIGAVVPSDVVCIAWDAGAERVWFRLNGGNWNNDASANPATGTNGLDCSFAASTAHALWMRFPSSSGGSATIRTRLAVYTQTVPSGFTSWMGESPPGVSVSITGQAVTTAVGTVTVTAVQKVSAAVTGQEMAVSVGTATVTGKATASVTGQAVTAAVGSATVTGKATATLTGQEIACTVGSVAVTAIQKATADVTGQQITALVNGVSVIAGGSVSVSVTGQQLNASVGTVAVTAIAGTVGVWNGTSWVQKPAKVWTGSAWVQKPVKTWNGTSWAA